MTTEKDVLFSYGIISNLVREGWLSVHAGCLAHYILGMNYTLQLKKNGKFDYEELTAEDIRKAIQVKSPSVGYRYITELVDKNIIDVVKTTGLPSKYKPNLSGVDYFYGMMLGLKNK